MSNSIQFDDSGFGQCMIPGHTGVGLYNVECPECSNPKERIAEMSIKCECGDSGCPFHAGRPTCNNNATVTVRRIDIDDGTSCFRMCEGCAGDAIDSGVFDAVYDDEPDNWGY